MMKKLLQLGLGLVLVSTVACSKKVKEDAAAGAGGPGDGAAISSEAMNFNAAGSDSGTIAGLRTVNFAYDSSVLDATARDILKENSDWIKSNANVSVQVEGHCDARGSVEYNLALGERRAKSVKDYLVSLGVDSKKLSVISYGKEKPLEIGDTEAVYAKNRRANFVPQAN